MKRKATDLEKKVFDFLNTVRETGTINMFGAAPEITRFLDIPLASARKYLVLWMDNFNEDGDYDEIEDSQK